MAIFHQGAPGIKGILGMQSRCVIADRIWLIAGRSRCCHQNEEGLAIKAVRLSDKR